MVRSSQDKKASQFLKMLIYQTLRPWEGLQLRFRWNPTSASARHHCTSVRSASSVIDPPPFSPRSTTGWSFPAVRRPDPQTFSFVLWMSVHLCQARRQGELRKLIVSHTPYMSEDPSWVSSIQTSTKRVPVRSRITAFKTNSSQRHKCVGGGGIRNTLLSSAV